MKEVKLQVPDGKRVEWKEVNGMTILVLVNEVKKDNRPVTERIKTFEDACAELGDKHDAVFAYKKLVSIATRENFVAEVFGKDVLAFLKLRIIAAALNEGWVPQFTDDEYRYYPYFVLYTQEEVDNMSEDERKELWLFGGRSYAGAICGLAFAASSNAWSCSRAAFSARLAVKSSELAKYFGKQFKELWADYSCPPAFQCASPEKS